MSLLKIIGVALSVSAATAASSAADYGQPIFLDTDLMTDVDDVGALAVANVLHNCGIADLRGVAINTRSEYGSLAASAINTYYGNCDVPIAAMRPLTNETFFDAYSFTLSEYASKVAYNWPRELEDAEATPSPVELYRSVLASADDSSMHLISIGFLSNLAVLLRSQPDGTSDLTGPQLISRKVSELIIMGGNYPSGWEWNFGGVDPSSTAYVLEYWPKDVPITFSGVELGSNVFSGQTLQQDAPSDSPILAAYEWYVGRCSTVRESWDPLTVLYGTLGLDGFGSIGAPPQFAFANQYGYNSITSKDGSNAWVNDTRVTNQHWLRLSDGVTNSSVAAMIDRLLTHDPDILACMDGGSMNRFVEQV